MNPRTLLLPLFALVAPGCADVDDHGHSHDENEFITTVALTFAPAGGGAEMVFRWADPEYDGNPTIDDIVLTDAATYDVSVAFFNELEEPVEDVTAEIADEADQHQVFFTGSAVRGPATGDNPSAVVSHAYADTDPAGLPVGLKNTFTALSTGSGKLTLTLRHMPPENGQDVKVQGLAEQVASGGFGAIGGENDVQATFDLRVE